MNGFLDWLFARLRERSTWLGLTGLLSAVGVAFEPEQAEAIIVAGMAVAGAVAVLTRDTTPPADPPSE